MSQEPNNRSTDLDDATRDMQSDAEQVEDEAGSSTSSSDSDDATRDMHSDAEQSDAETKSESNVISSADEQSTAVRVTENEDVEEAILYAKKYLEDLLSFFGLNTDVYATTEDHEVIELNVPSTHLNGFLIGQRGDTMRSLQYLISSALKSQNFSHTRVNVDVADYKKHRANRLAKDAEEWFKEVQNSGEPKDLMPMNAADRRVVHKAASDYGLNTQSTGEGRDRHIVLKPGGSASDSPAEPETDT